MGAYSTQDIEFLKNHWQDMSSYELAEKLGRKQGSISRKLLQLGCISEKARKIQESKKLRKEGKQLCLLCRAIYPWTEEYFHRQGPCLASVCKTCASARARKTYYENHDSLENALKHKIQKAKRVNKSRFYEFLTVEDAIQIYHRQNGRCFYTGEELTYEAGHPNSLCMDRQDPKVGYTKNNVVLCCNIINYMKQSLSPGDFTNWCSRVCDHSRQVNA